MRSLVAALILVLSLPAAAQDLDALFRNGMAAVEQAYAETDDDRRDALLDEAITAFRAMLVSRPDLVRVRLELARAFFLKGEDGPPAFRGRPGRRRAGRGQGERAPLPHRDPRPPALEFQTGRRGGAGHQHRCGVRRAAHPGSGAVRSSSTSMLQFTRLKRSCRSDSEKASRMSSFSSKVQATTKREIDLPASFARWAAP